MAATTMVHIRLDENVKAQATETLAAMGLSVSDAVRVFLTRVAAEKQLPFALKVPNVETRAAIEEADAIVRTRRARFTKAPICSMTSKRTAASKRAGPPRSADQVAKVLTLPSSPRKR
jgi:DNA-damage-inducible protein J